MFVLLQRQQNKVQPKLDLATAHFPPLPNSSSSDGGAPPTSAPPITSHSHTSTEDGPKTLSDIVRGGSRSQTKEITAGPAPNPTPSPAVVASNMVEKTIASASAKVSQTTSGPSSLSLQTPQESASPTTVNSDPSPQTSPADGQPKIVHSGSDVSGGGSAVTTVTSRTVTASSVVSSGGGGFAHQTAGSRAPPPPPAPVFTRNQKSDPNKVS